MALNKTALIEEIAGKANASKSDAQRFFDAFTEVVTDSLRKARRCGIQARNKHAVLAARRVYQGLHRDPGVREKCNKIGTAGWSPRHRIISSLAT